ncbi:MAG: hypothetical protein QM346_14775 [Chloroflexota bacterium]|nr:hypothetical protein [Chloroflexota bacterium]
MAPKEYSDAEIKLTAALYAKRSGVVDHIRTTGRLPDEIPSGGMGIAMQKLINRRGRDITLTPDEQLVYDAILREKRLPGGGVRLISRPKPDQDSQDG